MRTCLILAMAILVAACSRPAPSASSLEPLLIQPGDLPAGMTAGQAAPTLPPLFKAIPAPTSSIWQEFARGTGQAGGVAAIIYTDQAQRAAALEAIEAGMANGQPAANIGEHATIAAVQATNLRAYDIVFTRCQAIAFTRLTGSPATLTQAHAIAYAQRLDSRLKTAVC